MAARALMIQGTGSSVGKSVLCAALCRIFLRRGVRVAPFKAQNMSNNAFVTADGGEISRAQAVQATAAGLAPSVDMNPILLKPEGDTGSQVIVRGKVWGRLSSADYPTRKALLWDAVDSSLRTLMSEHELVVIEGAGSPAEVNLKAGDIANMRVARAADAPVFLVGDIERGGVFASLIGTIELLESEERDRVRGFIINRFRGDLDLLRPGLDFLQKRTGRPVLGVVPHLFDLDLPEEDTAALQSRRPPLGAATEKENGLPLRVAAVRLPRLANFDDLDPLRQAGADVVWVERPPQLDNPDLIVLPGSKSTAADLEWMQNSGLSDVVIALADTGTPVIGLCGGYQMLGEVVDDPEAVESSRGSTPGLGLLPITTVLQCEKTTRQARGRLLAGRGLFAGANSADVHGYEIHAGHTSGPGTPLLELRGPDGPRAEGRSARSGWIVGTYLHGLLHNPILTRALLANLSARRKGAPLPTMAASQAVADPYERLADQVEAVLDMPALLALVGLDPLPNRSP